MAKNILQEAIADAKLVKETALANARLQLEEAFQPTLQRMISTKIQEEDGDEELDIDINYDDDMGGEEEGGEDIGMASFDDGGEEEVPETPEEEPAMEGEEDMELESLIRELEGEDDEMMEEGEEENWADPIDDLESVDESEEMEDEMVERVLERLLREEEGLGDLLDSGENHEDGSAFSDNPPTRELNQENRQLKRQVSKLKKDLNEALRAVTTMKTAFNEVNLLNAKLMYATKLFKSNQLSEGQRNKVIDSLDRANNVREVKLVYTALVESFNRTSKRKVTEGFASKSTPVIKQKSKSTLNEGMVKRMQQLANILPLED